MEDLILAKIVDDGCLECLHDLLEESKSRYPLEGEVVMIPESWLDKVCAHGNSGLKFERVAVEADEEGDEESEVEFESELLDTRMDATKNIGYPAREWPCTTQRYGSHPMLDPYDDESSPDGSGTYSGV
jgi:hypothetical protein